MDNASTLMFLQLGENSLVAEEVQLFSSMRNLPLSFITFALLTLLYCYFEVFFSGPESLFSILWSHLD